MVKLSKTQIRMARRAWAVAGTLLLTACGGGGGGGGGSDSWNANTSWTPGSFAASGNFANLCAAPRSGTNPATGYPYEDQPGSTLEENHWLRSWSNELYLWYDEIVDRDPDLYSTPEYFELLKTEQTTASGAPKDQFHFSYASADWYSLSQAGVSAGYGASWIILEDQPPREILVAYTQPDSPATNPSANLQRGARVISVDGESVVDGTNVDVLNNGLFPDRSGESHTFVIQDQGTLATRIVTMTSANVTALPVSNVKTIPTASGDIGYLLFNEHIATAEVQLLDAIGQLASAGVVDLIVDLRYNGGGYLPIASQLAYMIAGPAATEGQVFEALEFNDKYPDTNPVTGQALLPTPFYSTTLGFSVTEGLALPSLNLQRVLLLTGANTCSASEAIINGLQGIGIEVIQIGATTCGKPYGFYGADNCGTTYFSIQFRGVNALGFGDYTDGFSPSNAAGAIGEPVKGCEVADDFSQPLGDINENRLQTALAYIENGGVCPSGIQGAGIAESLPVNEGVLNKSPFLENRVMVDLQ